MGNKLMEDEKELNDTILKIDNVRKEYVLGTVTGDTLKDAFKEKFGKNR